VIITTALNTVKANHIEIYIAAVLFPDTEIAEDDLQQFVGHRLSGYLAECI
jgi:hypothetical protein